MSSKVLTLNNGTNVPLFNFSASPEYWQDANRDVLSFQIAKGTIPFDILDALTVTNSDAIKNLTVTETIIVQDAKGKDIEKTNIFPYKDYGIRMKLSSESICTVRNIGNAPDVYEDLLILKLAQYSYAEIQAAQLQVAVDALTLATLGV